MSLEIRKEQSDKTILFLTGRLDTTTTPKLEAFLEKELPFYTNVILDLKELDYISSAGLRILLKMQKVMNKQGTMVLRNVQEVVKEILEITGFLNILTVE